jgi:iron complex transport system ATP-binding protein
MSDRADVLAAQSVSYRVHDVSLVSKTDLGVAAGEVVAVLGPNGAGKSTLLKVMAGELSPASGRVVVDGRDLAILKAGELARLRAVVAQSSNLSFPFTVREVVRLGVSVPGLSRENPRIERAVGDAIGRVGLAAFSGRLFTELSGGERQRTHIARALCQLSVARDLAGGGKILLLDEPTSSLDVGHQVVVLEALRREADAGTAILMVMHDLNLAAAFADRVVIMSHGCIIADGPPRQAMTEAILSRAYECPLSVGRPPTDGIPFVIPALGQAKAAKGARL